MLPQTEDSFLGAGAVVSGRVCWGLGCLMTYGLAGVLPLTLLNGAKLLLAPVPCSAQEGLPPVKGREAIVQYSFL